jgi:hypothetical protein
VTIGTVSTTAQCGVPDRDTHSYCDGGGPVVTETSRQDHGVDTAWEKLTQLTDSVYIATGRTEKHLVTGPTETTQGLEASGSLTMDG